MPATTYLSDNSYKEFIKVSDEELNELFQEIRKIYPDILLEQIVTHKIKGLFKKRIIFNVSYTIYNDLGWGEAQIICFQQGYRVDSNTVHAYFYGLLAKRKVE